MSHQDPPRHGKTSLLPSASSLSPSRRRCSSLFGRGAPGRCECVGYAEISVPFKRIMPFSGFWPSPRRPRRGRMATTFLPTMHLDWWWWSRRRGRRHGRGPPGRGRDGGAVERQWGLLCVQGCTHFPHASHISPSLALAFVLLFSISLSL